MRRSLAVLHMGCYPEYKALQTAVAERELEFLYANVSLLLIC